MAYPEYYNLLGVKPDASPDEIKKSYIRLVKQYHPDTHQGNKAAEEKLKHINEAYDVLKDFAKRAEYDYMGTVQSEPETETDTSFQEPEQFTDYPQPYSSAPEYVYTETAKATRKFHFSLRFILGKLFLLAFLVLYAIFIHAHRDPRDPDNLFKMFANSSYALIQGGKDLVHFGISKLGASQSVSQFTVDMLFDAVRRNNPNSVRILLRLLPSRLASVYVNAPDAQKNNRTPLMEAQHPEIISMLLEAGAVVSRADNTGETALTLAIRRNDAVAVELLLQASPSATDYVLPDGLTPMDLAVRNNNTVIMTLLQKRMQH